MKILLDYNTAYLIFFITIIIIISLLIFSFLALPGFGYSEAMKSKGITWNESNLDLYLEKPKNIVPGGKMVFAGMKKAEERKDVIAFLRDLK